MLVIVTSHPIQYQAPLWRALAAAGVNFEVWFLTPHAVAPSLDRQFGRTFAWDVDLLSGYSHRFLPIRPGWRLDRFCGVRLADNWASMLRTRGVTHLWIEGWRFATLWRAAHAADRLGLELWLRGETTDLKPERGPRAFARRLALRWLFRRVDQFLHIGTANHRFYAGCGVPDAKLHHAPYCVDNEYFAAQAEYFRPQRGALRARWGIPNDAWTVLFCGKLINKKRPLDLIEAAAMAQPKASRAIHLLFAGDGELAPAVRALLARTGVPGTVTGFLNQSQVPAAYAAADCLVLPSDHNETWGLVANEALASGLGIIVSDQCGCAEDLAAPLGPAHVYRCGDPRALASALLHCTERPIDPEVIRLAAASHHIRHTVGTVQSILGRQSRP